MSLKYTFVVRSTDLTTFPLSSLTLGFSSHVCAIFFKYIFSYPDVSLTRRRRGHLGLDYQPAQRVALRKLYLPCRTMYPDLSLSLGLEDALDTRQSRVPILSVGPPYIVCGFNLTYSPAIGSLSSFHTSFIVSSSTIPEKHVKGSTR